MPFEIPDSWEWCQIANLGKIVTGTTPSKLVGEYYNGEFPFYKPTDLEQGINTLTSSDSLTLAGLEASRFLPKRSILVTCIGATIGKTGVIQREGSCNQQINAIIPYSYCNPSYIYYCIISGYIQNAIKSNASATTLPILNKSDFSNLLFPLPPFSEQQRIVQDIEKWFALIDDIEAHKSDLLDYIKQAKSKVLDLAIHGKLVPQDPNDEPAIDLLKRINPSFKPCDTSHYENLPKGWKVCHLSEVIDLLDNKRQPIKAEVRAERIKGKKILFPYYGATGFAGYIDDYLIEGKFILLGEDGAPFLDKYAEKAYAVGGKIWVNNHAHVLQPKIDFDYLRIYLNAFDYYGIAKGTTRLKLTQGDMNQIPVWVPPLQEQMKISSKVQAVFTAIDTITAEL